MNNFITTFGLHPLQLHDVFPHHIVIGSDMRVKQVGQGLISILYPQSPSSLDNNKSSLIGSKLADVFSISAPAKCEWSWQHINQNERAVFEVELIDTNLLRRNRLKRLPLKGSVVITSTHSEETSSSVMEYTAIFLFCLSFTELGQLRDCGYSASDINRYTFQRDMLNISKLLSIFT